MKIEVGGYGAYMPNEVVGQKGDSVSSSESCRLDYSHLRRSGADLDVTV
jgi:hypothetical protein